MEIFILKTNITSPIGIQLLWDTLKSLGINQFNIDFHDVNKVLKVVSERVIGIESVIHAIRNLGYQCEELS
ncbi:hypothetical protein VB796_17765 [Arcicella sp. LKC2W]|uniref:hypothetical protein n=1 Tax=Arcicella sp. LKC2W TaxID=2984198 RepID=UPI002B1F5D69|nr:hypothetical protein [Arcicella sp. LKC2W]MEA5460912.1 hypothetical protein [Arcicella sp. LKC2W]